RIGEQNLADARELGGGLGRRLGARARDKHVDRVAQRCGCRERLARRRVQRAIGVLRQQKDRHRQSTPASVLSLATSSATLPTLTPAFRLAGSVIFRTLSCGAMSTPKSAGFFTSSGFFFAFITLGSEG